MKLDALATPVPVIDLDVLERNLARMARRAQAAGVALRPHAKTHKTLELARRQLAEGAVGLTVAKTAEAEVYAAAGFDDLFVAYPVVGLGKPERLLAVARQMARSRLAVGVDSVEGARALGAPFAAAGLRLRVRLEIDTGQHRTGVLPADAAALARVLAALPGLEFEGVFTHGGQAYACTADSAREERAREEAALVVLAAEAIRRAGIPCPVVSLGSTPTAAIAMAGAGVTEVRPGNYVFHDATQVALGTCSIEDCALSVLATVVSVPAAARAVLDAGSKTLSSDGGRPTPDGFGIVAGTQSRVAGLSEEHGEVAVAPGERFEVGQRVRVIPNHSCVVSNLHDALVVVRRGEVVERWPVAARGRVE